MTRHRRSCGSGAPLARSSGKRSQSSETGGSVESSWMDRGRSRWGRRRPSATKRAPARGCFATNLRVHAWPLDPGGGRFHRPRDRSVPRRSCAVMAFFRTEVNRRAARGVPGQRRRRLGLPQVRLTPWSAPCIPARAGPLAMISTYLRSDPHLSLEDAEAISSSEAIANDRQMPDSRGYGLRLFDRLADRWGVYHSGRTTVWFEVEPPSLVRRLAG